MIGGGLYGMGLDPNLKASVNGKLDPSLTPCRVLRSVRIEYTSA